MDKYTYMAVTNRINEIIQEQLHILEYLDSKFDLIINQQKENMSLLRSNGDPMVQW